MNVIRPIAQKDFAALLQIAEESGIGFTSLPVDDTLLQNKIEKSQTSFSAQISTAGDEGYLFVLEDSITGEILGTSGIEAKVGVTDPFYHYHMGKVVHASRELNIYNTVDILTFCNDYTGVSEICTLFLRETARVKDMGKFLSKTRFLFMAEHPERFSTTVIAEMRGINDENGRSPFWEWLEKHFFSIDFPTADYLTGIGKKVFIAELMPKYPIYVNLLSDAAQAVIGKVHDKTKPALNLLQKEGFVCRGYVDIFDAGPTVEADLPQIKTVRESISKPVIAGKLDANASKAMICNTSLSNFRAVMQPVNETPDHIIVSSETLAALQLVNGDPVRFCYL
ncbi:arginine N-succinyltransferase [Alteromonas sp. LMIT006]|uniref:arginine N-succinyltransferase n=1 Tax=Alteromonadaceae TaxID=72275 RepID=UPI0020CA7F00|nr:arginine N-succinyltransferase [Alteromonas sp. LMIT006]UTP72954.1 arginine N-succinyltransferase [Alteromonas sp. LMIT006]